MKFKYKTLKSYIGAKCRQEGGKSEAKIHDALQIANLIADDLFEMYNTGFPSLPPEDLVRGEMHSVYDLFVITGARRYLKRMGKNK